MHVVFPCDWKLWESHSEWSCWVWRLAVTFRRLLCEFAGEAAREEHQQHQKGLWFGLWEAHGCTSQCCGRFLQKGPTWFTEWLLRLAHGSHKCQRDEDDRKNHSCLAMGQKRWIPWAPIYKGSLHRKEFDAFAVERGLSQFTRQVVQIIEHVHVAWLRRCLPCITVSLIILNTISKSDLGLLKSFALALSPTVEEMFASKHVTVYWFIWCRSLIQSNASLRKLSLLACCWVPLLLIFHQGCTPGENNDIQTPFGEILETEGIKNETGPNGHLFGSCNWSRQEPIWQSASDAVVWRNGDNLVYFAVNKPLVKSPESEWTLGNTVFWKAELPTLARYPPAEGFRVLNEHHHVRCCHLMPLIRSRIEQNGLLSDWQKVDSFSCIDVDQVSQPFDRQNLKDHKTEFLKPGEKLSEDCHVDRALTQKLYEDCRAHGKIDFKFFENVARQFPPDYIPHINKLRLPQLFKTHGEPLVMMIPDILEMFDTSIVLEICLVQFTKERGN